jgi:molybdopterin-dependent oxidoreductase alpha subunit
MSQRNVPGIKRYDGPAGGWGALRATAKAVREQMEVTEAPQILFQTNKPNGFDCPGCAWPDKEHTSTFQFCENGAKAVTWEATKKRATPEFFAANTVTSLLKWTDYELENEGRLTDPVIYDHATDKFKAISWDEAFTRIGAILRNLPDPNMAEFYTSGRASNEAAFLYQLFVREYGTNNFPDCSNMCHEATSQGLPKSVGLGKGSVSLDDFEHCDLIIDVGHNPGTNHPRMMGTLHEAARRKVPIVVLNPLKERALERFTDPQHAVEMATFSSTKIASSYYQVKIGGDAAAMKGIMKAVLALDEASGGKVLDYDFIRTHTNGIEGLIADLNATAWADIERASGLQQADMEAVAAIYAKSKAVIIAYGMGITQHAKGTGTVQQLVNLLLLRGNMGKPGAGICPVRGHSNVQGDRTVGINERPSEEMLDSLERTFGFKVPRHHGHDAVEAFKCLVEGHSKALICLGGNLAVAMPDPDACYRGVRSADLNVQIITKLNRSALLIAKETIILPCLGRTEEDIQASGAQAVTVEDSMSMVHASRGQLAPVSGNLRSEPSIVAHIARATLPDTKVDWMHLIADYDRIRDKIEAVLPGFTDYNKRIRQPGGFRLPVPSGERIWNTASGKAEFLVFDGLNEDQNVIEKGALLLATIRSHDQYNTTIYGNNDRYRGVFGRRDVVFMSKEDLAENKLEHGDVVDIETTLPNAEGHRLEGFTVIAYDIARGSVAAYYPEANCLIPLAHQDKTSGTPAYKSVPVKITRRAA